jgi:hypothetical protein
VRSFPFRNYVPTPGLPVGPGWISIQDNQPIVTEVLGEAGVETAYCTDNPFLVGPRFANFRRTLDFVKPSFSQGAYRFLNKPFKRPAPRSAIERYLLPELSDSVEVGRPPLDGRLELDLPRLRPRLPHGARLPQRHQPRRRPEEEAPFFLGVDGFDPHEPLDAPKVFQDKYGGPKGIEKTLGITPIQPFETPYSWVIDMKLDPDTIERVRELYAAEIAFTDEWVGRLMNRLADQKLLDETVVIYSSDHGLTLGEQGIVGKHGARAQWPIYHVPFFIRHPEGKLAGQWDDFYASNHDIAKTATSFMGVRAPGMMTGDDLSVIFDGKRPPPRPHFTSCYDDYVLAATTSGSSSPTAPRFRPQLYDQKKDPLQETNVADQHPDLVEKYWRILSDEAGGTCRSSAATGRSRCSADEPHARTLLRRGGGNRGGASVLGSLTRRRAGGREARRRPRAWRGGSWCCRSCARPTWARSRTAATRNTRT